ncbi:MAG: hypothetical protein ACXVB9_04725 [Bdellovibrionota bacterium]
MKFCLHLLFLITLAHATGSLTEEQGANELAKELNGLNKQAEQVLQQVDKVTGFQPVTPQTLDKTKETVLKLANDERFLSAAKGLWASEKRKELFLIQAGFFLFMMLFKAWRQSRAHHWFKRLLVGFALSLINWAGMLYVIPLLVLGEPFAIFTGTLWRVLMMGG